MKYLTLSVIILSALCHLHAEETYVSKEFHFMAKFPEEVDAATAKHQYGIAGSFQAADTKNNLIIAVTTDTVPPLESVVTKGTATPKQLIESNFTGVKKESGALPKTVITKWTSWNYYDCLEFSYTSNTFEPHGLTTYHIGKAFFVTDTFYYLQIVAFQKESAAPDALKHLVDSFAILSSPDKTSN